MRRTGSVRRALLPGLGTAGLGVHPDHGLHVSLRQPHRGHLEHFVGATAYKLAQGFTCRVSILLVNLPEVFPLVSGLELLVAELHWAAKFDSLGELLNRLDDGVGLEIVLDSGILAVMQVDRIHGASTGRHHRHGPEIEQSHLSSIKPSPLEPGRGRSLAE